MSHCKTIVTAFLSKSSCQSPSILSEHIYLYPCQRRRLSITSFSYSVNASTESRSFVKMK
eukprot:scaffold16645_cov78-Skeletonema_marinoi.AAC.2